MGAFCTTYKLFMEPHLNSICLSQTINQQFRIIWIYIHGQQLA